jgi:hypothetical protein
MLAKQDRLRVSEVGLAWTWYWRLESRIQCLPNPIPFRQFSKVECIVGVIARQVWFMLEYPILHGLVLFGL